MKKVVILEVIFVLGVVPKNNFSDGIIVEGEVNQEIWVTWGVLLIDVFINVDLHWGNVKIKGEVKEVNNFGKTAL